MAEDVRTGAEAGTERAERVRFCSRCGGIADGEAGERPGCSRVCAECGMGVYLEATREALGPLGTFFLVVTRDLRVSAVSVGAEGIFGDADDVVGSQLGELLASPLGAIGLDRTVRRAAMGVRERVAVPVTPVGEGAESFGPLEARVSPCGPPRAALVAIEPAVG